MSRRESRPDQEDPPFWGHREEHPPFPIEPPGPPGEDSDDPEPEHYHHQDEFPTKSAVDNLPAAHQCLPALPAEE